MLSPSKTQKNTFITIFYLFSLLLMILPLLVSFNEGLTQIVEATPIYKAIQAFIVPLEIRVVASFLYILNIPTFIQSDGLTVNGTFLRVTWNCLGWQSLLFLLITFMVGFQGRYTFFSVGEAILFGLLGTFLLNIMRILLVSLLGAYAPSLFALVFHDYLAAITTVAWLFFFWWFSYSFVLEERKSVVEENTVKV